MPDQNTSNLVEIINRVEKNEILLPDFQRDFVWKDEEQQKKLVASVLCKMPVGTILLLESNPNDYAANVIGCAKKVVDTSKINGDVSFLLDGQQRITVLTNVFSNAIHDNCPKVSELVSPALKRRFFLKIPKWSNRPDRAEDWFGIGTLEFPLSNPSADLPDFLTSQMLNYIHVETFNASDSEPYNPAVGLSIALDQFCISYPDGYLIPLFLMAKPLGNNKNVIILRFDEIIKGVAEAIRGEIMNFYATCENDTDRFHFTEYIFGEEVDEIYNQLDKQQAFQEKLIQRQKIWRSQMKDYLYACINNLSLHQIIVKADQRARAIDIYENLNRGGVCLNTFDLIMARVAKVNKENFNQRIRRLMMEKKTYPDKVLPDKIRMVLVNDIQNHKYNATGNTKCLNEAKNELNVKYVDIFLDVLGLYSYVPNLDPDQIKLDYIKKARILDLKPEDIDKNCDKVIEAIDRAMFFLQTRCGIRSLQEVNYSLMVVLIAVVFIEDTYFYDKDVHDLIEGWYWSVLFSGEYDKDQNVNFINNLKNMLKTVKKQMKADWIIAITANVFLMTNFSDKQLLLMDKAAEDRYPKRIMAIFVCQYMLSRTYKDMFDSSKTISVFCKEAAELQMHHIIPLGTAKKIGEVTADLRKNPKHICNSPLNFVLITKEANKEISDEALDKYVTKITPEAKAELFITAYITEDSVNTDEKIYGILENRFDMMNGLVRGTINDHNERILTTSKGT